MSGLVERLAEKWDEYISTVEPQPTEELPWIEARWWLRAIAEELEEGQDLNGECHVGEKAARWLRTEAER